MTAIKINKFILITINIIFLIFISSCSNKKIINLDNDNRQINVIDKSGSVIKTYFEKYSSIYNGWLKASCSENLKKKCKFTNLSLTKIISLINDNNEDKIVNDSKSISSKNELQKKKISDQEKKEEEIKEEEIEDTPPFIPESEIECIGYENC